jgi:exopolysaccharide production protein ExoZ
MSGKKKIEVIQGLRGVAAGLVVVHHLALQVESFGLPSFSHGFTHFGASGVDIFFLISGYLIASILRKSDDTRGFLLKRAIRVVPLLWVTNVVTVGYNVQLGRWPDPWVFLSSSVMLPGMVKLPIVQPYAWSLSYEFAFYTSAALFAMAFRRSGVRDGWLRLRACFG